MSTNLKKLAALASGALAVPALLFLGAGTAQAKTSVSSTTDALGVTVQIHSLAFDPSSGWCTYTAVPVDVPAGVLPPLPVYDVPFFLQAGKTHNLWFPGVQTGSSWDVAVKCAEGTNSPTRKYRY